MVRRIGKRPGRLRRSRRSCAPGRADRGDQKVLANLLPLIRAHMTQMSDEKRTKLAELVGRLYTLRCFADYRPSVHIDARDAREAVSIIEYRF
jgi:hypothetical protein